MLTHNNKKSYVNVLVINVNSLYSFVTFVFYVFKFSVRLYI